MNQTYIAKTLFGLELVLEKELQKLGASNTEILNRAVKFQGDLELLYKCNFQLRTAIKILQPILEFNAHNDKELYEAIYKYDWSNHLDVNKTFAIDAAVNSEFFNHSQYVALKAKDSIADFFRNKYGKRPNVDIVMPQIRINIHVFKNQITVSLDSSGESLHKRYWRKGQGIAPLNEVLAAGMISLSEFDGERDFYDVFCGSGTLLVEALMVATNTPAQLNRDEFCFMYWGNFDKNIWGKVKENAISKTAKPQAIFFGSDYSHIVLNKAEDNIRNLGFKPYVRLQKSDFRKVIPQSENGVIVTNPPYGERIDVKELTLLYKDLGDCFKTHFTGFDAWVLCPQEVQKFIGLKPGKKYKLINSTIECNFNKYELYRGSKKGGKEF